MWAASSYVLQETEQLSGLAQQPYMFSSQALSHV